MCSKNIEELVVEAQAGVDDSIGELRCLLKGFVKLEKEDLKVGEFVQVRVYSGLGLDYSSCFGKIEKVSKTGFDLRSLDMALRHYSKNNMNDLRFGVEVFGVNIYSSKADEIQVS